MSECLEGISVLWTGSKLLNRKHQQIHAPFEFISKLPEHVALEGMLWAGRQNFSNLLRAFKEKSAWETIAFYALDCPTIESSFEERNKYIQSLNVKYYSLPV